MDMRLLGAFVGNAACTAKYLAHTHFIAGLHRGVGSAAHPPQVPGAVLDAHHTAPAAIGVHGGHLTGGGSTHLCVLCAGVVHTVVGAPVAKGAAVHQLIAAVCVQDPARDGLRGGRRS